ncbi:hypothetical protein AMECASPLE_014989 [Ameca splendens]|uniref:Uncharacterized protein n=1 Tax=Ameca splendens TaxID=208324 RepID=A0ABV0Y1M2_9TELE
MQVYLLGQAAYTCEKGSNHWAIYTQLEPLQHIPASQGGLFITGIFISDNCTWLQLRTGSCVHVAAESVESNAAATFKSAEINAVGRRKTVLHEVDYRKCH